MGKKTTSRNSENNNKGEQVEHKKEGGKEFPVVCGLVMPISEIDECSAEHWMQVRDIIEEALGSINIQTNLVSDGDEVGIIQERIVQNLYDRPIVVCDVSCKNPNVMFELGLRLAFDMPTVVIKDDKTNYSFDTSPLEQLSYPRDLNYWSIQEFKKILSGKVLATLKKKKEDPEYSPFLKAFNKKRVAHIETTDVTSVEYFMDELKEIKNDIRNANQSRDTLYLKNMLELVSRLGNKNSSGRSFLRIFESPNDWNKFNEECTLLKKLYDSESIKKCQQATGVTHHPTTSTQPPSPSG